MSKTLQYLGVIPARGGSKGIPGKNIKMIAGQPLIGWTISAAKKSKLLSDFIVSTDSIDIATVAASYGVVALPRPPHLAEDTSLIIDTLRHLVSVVDCDNVVMLQPTSPVRRKTLIDTCIREHMDKKVDTVITGFDCYYKEYCEEFVQRRQEIKPFFYDDGNVYVFTRKMIEEGRLKSNNNAKIYTNLYERFEVDDLETWRLVEKILEGRWNEEQVSEGGYTISP